MAKTRRCRYCQRTLLDPKKDRHRNSKLSATRDHIVAKSRGGETTVWCCRSCNQLKGDLSLIEWCKFMQDYPAWWQHFETHHQVRQTINRQKLRPKSPRNCTFKVRPPPLCRGLTA